jgi:transcriptional regulator with XRE-family HTH domain
MGMAMRVYQAVWLSVWIPLAMVGVGLTLVQSLTGFAALFIGFAVVGATLMACMVDDSPQRSSTDCVRFATTGALIGGVIASAVAGFVVLLGAAVLLLVVTALASSPYAVGAYGRWLSGALPPSAARLDALARAFAYTVPEYAACQPPSELGLLTDDQLCQAWRASFMALQPQSSTTQKIAAIAERQRYLDELERRNETGFLAWLVSGEPAPGNPLPYLTGTRPDNFTIKWDELTRGRGW